MFFNLRKILFTATSVLAMGASTYLCAAEYQPPQRSFSGSSSSNATVPAPVIDQHITTPEEKIGSLERVISDLTGRLERLEHENAQLKAKLEGARTGKEPMVPTAQTGNSAVVAQGPKQPATLPPLQEVQPGQQPVISGNLQPQLEPGMDGGMPYQPMPSPQSMVPQTMMPQNMTPQPMNNTPSVLPGASLTPTPVPQPKEMQKKAEEESLPLVSEQQQASKTQTFKNPKEQYDYARSLVMESKFAEAQPVLQDFVQKYPKHELNENALYWLGETYFVQAQYNEAAGRFAESYKKFPKGKKAPDTLLKLGMSLNAMGRNQDACLTYEQIDLTKKDLPANIVQKTQAEKIKAGCKGKQ